MPGQAPRAGRQAPAVSLSTSGGETVSLSDFRGKKVVLYFYPMTFPLLSDPDASVCKAYGVYKQKSMYGRTYWGIERTTVLIDERGRIERVFPKVSVDGHTEAVLEALRNPAGESGKRV